MGTLSLSVTYLTTPNFQLDELESLLSSRFLSLDTGPEFTPTLAKNQQRDSLTGSRGSLPTRMSLPQKSPTSSVVDRFVLPSRVASLGLSPRNAPLPITRFPSAGTAESNSGPSLPIRRPHINPVHPFKASTLSSGSPSHHSSSTSLRQPSPLSSLGLPSLPSRPIQTQPQMSPTSARLPPLVGSRPSPPFTPSSLGDRRSLTSAEGDRDREDGSPRALLGQGRKRYSSSFGHRYAASLGAGSEGSAGSGERREGERVGVSHHHHHPMNTHKADP
jgi:autophagy-related protein 13